MILVGLSALTVSPAQAHDFKLATWNLDWLSLRSANDPSLPPDVIRRSPADFAHLAQYAAHLDADIVGLQEIDTPEAADLIFPNSRYRVILTDDTIPQRVGIAVRRGIDVQINPELKALDVAPPDAAHHLRGGLDVTLHDHAGGPDLRILVVHLKSGCWDHPLKEREYSCPTLRQQFAVLDDWVLQRQDEGVAFAVMGDFNRRLTFADPLLQELEADAPMTLTTSGRASPCWGGNYFIDHILLGNDARQWLRPDSLRVMLFHPTESEEKARLSDHCPVSVRLSMPSRDAPSAVTTADGDVRGRG